MTNIWQVLRFARDVRLEKNERDMSIARYYYKVWGEVQGVGFRRRAASIAGEIGLTGWVKNVYDGSVELEVQGEEEELRRFLSRIEQACGIDIESVKMREMAVKSGEASFSIR